MKFVFTCSRLQHDGRKQLLAVTTPCSGTQTYLYTIYLVVCTCKETNPLRYYCKLRCAIFLFENCSFVIRKVRTAVTVEKEKKKSKSEVFNSEGQEILTKQADISKDNKKDIVIIYSFTLYCSVLKRCNVTITSVAFPSCSLH